MNEVEQFANALRVSIARRMLAMPNLVLCVGPGRMTAARERWVVAEMSAAICVLRSLA